MTPALPALLMVALTAIAPLSSSPNDVATSANNYCSVAVAHPNTVVCASTREAMEIAWAASDLSPDAQITVAILYDNANMDSSAGEYDIHAASDCTASKTGVDLQISDLGSAWHNRVSSFQGYGNCAVRLWSSTGFSGTAYPGTTTFLASSTYVGASFNDKAQSVQLS